MHVPQNLSRDTCLLVLEGLLFEDDTVELDALFLRGDEKPVHEVPIVRCQVQELFDGTRR